MMMWSMDWQSITMMRMISKLISCRQTLELLLLHNTSQTGKLTEEDEKKAREEAIKRLTEEQYAMLKKKPSRSKKEATEVKQMSLF